MSEDFRLPDYLKHIEQAATEACDFVEGLPALLKQLPALHQHAASKTPD